jgi:transcriptional regulator ATRX
MLSKALSRVVTRRRILLTGTPLQNNLMEYFHMVDFVNPGKLGDVGTFKNLFVEHINRGAVSHNDADDRKRRKAMDRRVFTLSKRLDTLVQRRGVEILTRTLPPRYDVVLTVRLSNVQRALYNDALLRTATSQRSVFRFQFVLQRIYDHPAMLLLNERKKKVLRQQTNLLDGDELVVDDALPALPSRWWEGQWPTATLSPEQVSVSFSPLLLTSPSHLSFSPLLLASPSNLSFTRLSFTRLSV